MTSESTSTVDLLEATVAEARELVQLELRIARAELKEEMQRLKRAAIAAGLAMVTLTLALAALLVALILALGATPQAAVLVALGFSVLAGSLGAFAYAAFPKALLPHTRQHLIADVTELKERAL